MDLKAIDIKNIQTNLQEGFSSFNVQKKSADLSINFKSANVKIDPDNLKKDDFKKILKKYGEDDSKKNRNNISELQFDDENNTLSITYKGNDVKKVINQDLSYETIKSLKNDTSDDTQEIRQFFSKDKVLLKEKTIKQNYSCETFFDSSGKKLKTVETENNKGSVTTILFDESEAPQKKEVKFGSTIQYFDFSGEGGSERITQKITNNGLPIEERELFSYTDNGNVKITRYSSQGQIASHGDDTSFQRYGTSSANTNSNNGANVTVQYCSTSNFDSSNGTVKDNNLLSSSESGLERFSSTTPAGDKVSQGSSISGSGSNDDMALQRYSATDTPNKTTNEGSVISNNDTVPTVPPSDSKTDNQDAIQKYSATDTPNKTTNEGSVVSNNDNVPTVPSSDSKTDNQDAGIKKFSATEQTEKQDISKPQTVDNGIPKPVHTESDFVQSPASANNQNQAKGVVADTKTSDLPLLTPEQISNDRVVVSQGVKSSQKTQPNADGSVNNSQPVSTDVNHASVQDAEKTDLAVESKSAVKTKLPDSVSDIHTIQKAEFVRGDNNTSGPAVSSQVTLKSGVVKSSGNSEADVSSSSPKTVENSANTVSDSDIVNESKPNNVQNNSIASNAFSDSVKSEINVLSAQFEKSIEQYAKELKLSVGEVKSLLGIPANMDAQQYLQNILNNSSLQKESVSAIINNFKNLFKNSSKNDIENFVRKFNEIKESNKSVSNYETIDVAQNPNDYVDTSSMKTIPDIDVFCSQNGIKAKELILEIKTMKPGNSKIITLGAKSGGKSYRITVNLKGEVLLSEVRRKTESERTESEKQAILSEFGYTIPTELRQKLASCKTTDDIKKFVEDYIEEQIKTNKINKSVIVNPVSDQQHVSENTVNKYFDNAASAQSQANGSVNKVSLNALHPELKKELENLLSTSKYKNSNGQIISINSANGAGKTNYDNSDIGSLKAENSDEEINILQQAIIEFTQKHKQAEEKKSFNNYDVSNNNASAPVKNIYTDEEIKHLRERITNMLAIGVPDVQIVAFIASLFYNSSDDFRKTVQNSHGIDRSRVVNPKDDV